MISRKLSVVFLVISLLFVVGTPTAQSDVNFGDNNIFEESVIIYDNSISNNGDGTITVNYFFADSTGKHIETTWTGNLQSMTDVFRGWEENDQSYQYFYFGHFMQETGDDDPILWRVLNVDRMSNRVLLLSDKILYAHPYGSSTWEESDIYEWLNNKFLLSAFNETERSALYHSNSRGTIFILSKSDYLKSAYGFSTKESADTNRAAKATTYAQDCGLIGAPYYTMTKSGDNAMVAVMGNGRIQEARRNRDDVGIRPAMWIDLSLADFDITGDGTQSHPFMLYVPE